MIYIPTPPGARCGTHSWVEQMMKPIKFPKMVLPTARKLIGCLSEMTMITNLLVGVTNAEKIYGS
jgi:hypothetical protein